MFCVLTIDFPEGSVPSRMFRMLLLLLRRSPAVSTESPTQLPLLRCNPVVRILHVISAVTSLCRAPPDSHASCVRSPVRTVGRFYYLTCHCRDITPPLRSCDRGMLLAFRGL